MHLDKKENVKVKCLRRELSDFGIESKTRYLLSMPYSTLKPTSGSVMVMINLTQFEFFLIRENWQHYFNHAEWKVIGNWYHNRYFDEKTKSRVAGRLAGKLAVQHLLDLPSLHGVSIGNITNGPFKGKPICSLGCHISISHSEDCIVAMASHLPIGVDVQQHRTFGTSALEYAFSEQERAFIAKASRPDRERISATIWAIKEAYLKARGIGIFPHIQSVEVDLNASEPQLIQLNKKGSNGLLSLSHCPPLKAFSSADYSLAYIELPDKPMPLFTTAPARQKEATS